LIKISLEGNKLKLGEDKMTPILCGTNKELLQIAIIYVGDFVSSQPVVIECTDANSYNEQLENILKQDKSFSIFQNLKSWRKDRGIKGYDHKTHVRCLIEELFELMHYRDEQIERKVKEFMGLYYFYPEELNMNTVIDASCDMNVFNINFTEQAGYDAKKCMEETIAEVSSRKGATNPETGKWEKFTDEEHKKLWYKADYEKCIIKG
jgi:hypothetical protein